MLSKSVNSFLLVSKRKTQRRPLSTVNSVLERLKLSKQLNSGIYNGSWKVEGYKKNNQINASTGEVIGSVTFGNLTDYEETIEKMNSVKHMWSNTPAPARGEVVRRIGEKLRERKNDLGMLVSLEMGKILTEGLGEVQEAIDICDFAVGLSRCLNGSVIPSERPGHMMMERYSPLKGHVGIITAFNFPVAVYFWNLALSLICGNTSLWKPNESVSLTAVAVTKIVSEAMKESGFPGEIASMICGEGALIGERIAKDPAMELVSFTGSTARGQEVSRVVAGRFGKTILELGGNNAMIVDESANLGLAVRASLFGAVGTCGQRCTTQRRLYLHENVYESFLEQLLKGYSSVKIGDPLDSSTLCGPLHNTRAVETFTSTVQAAVEQGGVVLCGGNLLEGLTLADGRKGVNFVAPTVIAMPDAAAPIVQEENFVPILYVMKIKSFQEAVKLNNAVSQGLSSALFTQNLEQILEWTGPGQDLSSDCGIVNVNIGTSGAEIGGAFGGEKYTGGGRESGSDSWKQYMRRSTCTINYSKDLPLAQGVEF